jgi:hypothetical protein
MAKQASPTLKTFSFGGCYFSRTNPAVGDLAPDTQILNIAIGFEEALKLHLAIGECVCQLNSYNRSTTAGKRTALNLVVHLSTNQVTISETKLAAKD